MLHKLKSGAARGLFPFIVLAVLAIAFLVVCYAFFKSTAMEDISEYVVRRVDMSQEEIDQSFANNQSENIHQELSSFALINKKRAELNKSGLSHDECKRELISYIKNLPDVKSVEDSSSGIFVEIEGQPFMFFQTNAFGEKVFCKEK